MGKKAVKNQNRGGLANFRGNTFEHLFAVWRVTLALEQLTSRRNTQLALQLKGCSVDDWVEDDGRERRFFQLKNTKQLSWAHVTGDFNVQLKRPVTRRVSRVTLVVGRRPVEKLLRRTMRARPFELLFFPSWIQPRRQVQSEPSSSALTRLCVLKTPTRSDLESLWSSIEVAWQNTRKPGKFVGVARVLDVLPDQNFPPLRCEWRPTKLWRRARAHLNAIAQLTCRIEDGHFFYDDGAGTDGRIPCRTSAFKEVLQQVLKVRPTNSKRFRELLP